jgi:hypothetical protein
MSNPHRALSNLIEFVSRSSNDTQRGVLLADCLVIARHIGCDDLKCTLQDYLRAKFGEETE